MKYKWKDKVRIKSKKELECISEVTDGMLKNGGAIMTIACLVEDADGYIMKEDGDFHFLWSDEMIEGLVEEETYDFLKTDKPNRPSLNDFMDMLDNEIKLPQGYQFKDENGNVINATKIVLEKKKKEYPKTYEECCEALEYIPHTDDIIGYKWNILQSLQKLLICRDTYWKIAGEDMGLGKPWEPDWTTDDVKHSLVNVGNTIILSVECKVGRILAFPTKEMRDAFYENFKELIEQCKELL